MKNPKKSVQIENPAMLQNLPDRLRELEAELHLHSTRKASERPLKSIGELVSLDMSGEQILQFMLGKNQYAAGHSDLTYAASNHARGVRHIRFYADKKMVLEIEGDFENQQFGTNFRFQNIDCYIPGEWEADFLKLTDELRHYAEKRKMAFKKSRDSKRKSKRGV